ncbi:MAG: hypothetical protein A2169_14380 [Deltaproteobacteria bacterium RBG_13_47_9]|nr:MAG: hypothetical protein A2169_14380 [Deltaproteobacteria bacterium RBG_13_47_9]
MKTPSNILLVIIIVFIGAMFVISYHFDYQQAKLAPLTISGLIIILAVIELIREVRFPRRWVDGLKGEMEKIETQPVLRRYLVEGAWMVGFVLAIYLLGFLIAIPLFGILYMKLHGTGWLPSLTVPALLLLFIFLIFSLILDFRFYPGIIFMG